MSKLTKDEIHYIIPIKIAEKDAKEKFMATAPKFDLPKTETRSELNILVGVNILFDHTCNVVSEILFESLMKYGIEDMNNKKLKKAFNDTKGQIEVLAKYRVQDIISNLSPGMKKKYSTFIKTYFSGINKFLDCFEEIYFRIIADKEFIKHMEEELEDEDFEDFDDDFEYEEDIEFLQD